MSVDLSSAHLGSSSTITQTTTTTEHVVGSGVQPSQFTSSGHLIRESEVESHKCIGLTGAKLFANITATEKKQMQELNDRLSNYIARVKLLEDQNRSLVASLSQLRSKWGTRNSEYKSSSYESLSVSRTKVDAAARSKAAVEVKAARLRDDIAEYRSRYEEVLRLRESDRSRVPQWTVAIKEAESELQMLRHRFEQVHGEERAVLQENLRIWGELHNIRQTLDAETTSRIDFQSQVNSIIAETQFLKRVHESEVRELDQLIVVAPADTKEFFKNELALAVRDIKREYELIASNSKLEIERWYKSKVSEVQASAGRLQVNSSLQTETMSRISSSMSELKGRYSEIESRNLALEKEVSSLQYQVTQDQRTFEAAVHERDATLIRIREQCHTLVAELQSLLDTKQMLDAEIAIYRAMLEGEEKRVGVVKMEVQKDTHDQWEVATKTRFQTTSHGNMAIVQCEPTGRFIVLENTSKLVDEYLDGWRLKRTIDHSREINYVFPQGTVVRAGDKIKIVARDQGAVSHGILMFEQETSWGMGSHIVTSLYNALGEERAVYTQTTTVG